MNQIGNQLIKDLKLEALSPEEQMAMVAQFGDVLFQAVLIRGLQSLTEAQKGALDAELAKGPENGPDVFMDFFMANIPNFQAIVDEEMKRIHDRAMMAVGGK
jgi:hypothetical protein